MHRIEQSGHITRSDSPGALSLSLRASIGWPPPPAVHSGACFFVCLSLLGWGTFVVAAFFGRTATSTCSAHATQVRASSPSACSWVSLPLYLPACPLICLLLLPLTHLGRNRRRCVLRAVRLAAASAARLPAFLHRSCIQLGVLLFKSVFHPRPLFEPPWAAPFIWLAWSGPFLGRAPSPPVPRARVSFLVSPPTLRVST